MRFLLATVLCVLYCLSTGVSNTVATSAYESLDVAQFIKENKLDWVEPQYITSLLEESNEVEGEAEGEAETEVDADTEVDAEAEGEVDTDFVPARSLSERRAKAEITVDLSLALDLSLDVNAKNPPKCTDDSKSRLRFCLNVLGQITTLQSSVVKEPGNDWNDHCKKLYPYSGQAVPRATCAKYAPQVFANPKSYYPLLRSTDPHNICISLLSKANLFALDQVPRCNLNPNLPAETDNGIPSITGLRCLFLHGVGEQAIQYPDGPGVTPNAPRQPFVGVFTHYREYWGHIHVNYEDVCDVRIFVTDTVTRGWSNPDLQQEYCDKVAQWKPHIVFTHSMGNMILGAGIAKKLDSCSSIVTAQQALTYQKPANPNGKLVTFWGGVQGPLLGSPLVSFLRSICGNWLLGKIKKFGQANRCAKGGVQPSYDSLDPNYQMQYSVNDQQIVTQKQGALPQLTCGASSAHQCITLKDIAKQYQYASICGINSAPMANLPTNSHLATGFFTDLGTLALDKINDWPNGDGKTNYNPSAGIITGNDGLVGFSSCRVQGENYLNVPTNRFYAVSASHSAGRCTYGENSKNQGEQPCTWFKTMITNRRVAEGLAPTSPPYILY